MSQNIGEEMPQVFCGWQQILSSRYYRESAQCGSDHRRWKAADLLQVAVVLAAVERVLHAVLLPRHTRHEVDHQLWDVDLLAQLVVGETAEVPLGDKVISKLLVHMFTRGLDKKKHVPVTLTRSSLMWSSTFQ